MSERRVAPRVSLDLEASYQVIEEVAPPQVAFSQDVSLGGMRLHHSKPLERGKKISLIFSLPTAGQVILHGVVVWCQEAVNDRGGYQAGVRWVEVSPISQARLNAYLTQRTEPITRIGATSITQTSISRWKTAKPWLLGLGLMTVGAMIFSLRRQVLILLRFLR